MPLRRSSLIFESNSAPLYGEFYEPAFIPAGPTHQRKHCALIDQLMDAKEGQDCFPGCAGPLGMKAGS